MWSKVQKRYFWFYKFIDLNEEEDIPRLMLFQQIYICNTYIYAQTGYYSLVCISLPLIVKVVPIPLLKCLDGKQDFGYVIFFFLPMRNTRIVTSEATFIWVVGGSEGRSVLTDIAIRGELLHFITARNQQLFHRPSYSQRQDKSSI